MFFNKAPDLSVRRIPSPLLLYKASSRLPLFLHTDTIQQVAPLPPHKCTFSLKKGKLCVFRLIFKAQLPPSLPTFFTPQTDALSKSSKPLVMSRGEFSDVVSLLEGAIEQ